MASRNEVTWRRIGLVLGLAALTTVGLIVLSGCGGKTGPGAQQASSSAPAATPGPTTQSALQGGPSQAETPTAPLNGGAGSPGSATQTGSQAAVPESRTVLSYTPSAGQTESVAAGQSGSVEVARGTAPANTSPAQLAQTQADRFMTLLGTKVALSVDQQDKVRTAVSQYFLGIDQALATRRQAFSGAGDPGNGGASSSFPADGQGSPPSAFRQGQSPEEQQLLKELGAFLTAGQISLVSSVLDSMRQDMFPGHPGQAANGGPGEGAPTVGNPPQGSTGGQQ